MKESQLRLLILEIVKQAKLFKEELSHNCTAHDITWKGNKGYQCLNCGAWAEHSWDIKHKKQNPSEKPKFFENDLNETLSPKSIATIEKWRRELGDRKTAVKLIDTVLERRIGIVSADLPDTATFANGLDAIEVLLKDGKYDSAIQQAIETAKDMVEEEGGEGLMEGDEADAVNDMWAGSDDAMPPEETEEPSEDALYVEYLKEMPGEKPFMLHGEKFQYVKAKYPDGKEDIGVYAFRGDLVYGYKAFRKRYNLK